VSAHDFVFALELSGEAPLDRLVAEVAAAVLTYVGSSATASAELTDAVRGAVEDRAARGAARCDVRFSARAGELEIVVSCAGHEPWRTSRRLS